MFGQAHPRSGIGVFSFARYDPSFDLDADSELELGNAHASVSPSDQVVDYLSTFVLWRSCKVCCSNIIFDLSCVHSVQIFVHSLQIFFIAWRYGCLSCIYGIGLLYKIDSLL